MILRIHHTIGLKSVGAVGSAAPTAQKLAEPSNSSLRHLYFCFILDFSHFSLISASLGKHIYRILFTRQAVLAQHARQFVIDKSVLPSLSLWFEEYLYSYFKKNSVSNWSISKIKKCWKKHCFLLLFLKFAIVDHQIINTR